MAATTSLLGLVTPTQGTLSGTWGDTVNYGISDYVDIAVSGTLTLTNDGAVTLANTTGSSSGNSITSSLTGAGTVTAQFAIVKVTGTLTTAKVVTGPSYSKTYTVVNSATGSTVTFKASGQTGVSIAVGETAFVYFNGTDYVKVVGTATAGAAGGSTTQVQYNNAGVLAGITGATTNGTALTLVAPVLGTPASATLTNATGLPISTGVSGLGTNVATFLATPSSANLISAVTDETGTGSLVFGTNPTLTGATLAGTVSGGGNQLNNVIIGTTTPLAGAFTTLSATKGSAGVLATLLSGNSAQSPYISFGRAAEDLRIQIAATTNDLFTGTVAGDYATNSNASIWFGTGGNPITKISSTGLAVTGTLSATTPIATTSGGTGLSSFTSGGVVYASSSSALATGSALTFDGSALGLTGRFNITAASNQRYSDFNTTSAGYGFSSFSYNGTAYGYIAQASSTFSGGSNTDFALSAVNSLVFGASNTEGMRLTSTGLGIGTSSPSVKLDVVGRISTSVGATTENALNINATTAGYGSVVTYQNGGVTKYTAGLNVFTGTGEWGIYDNASALIRFYLSSTGNVGIGTSSPSSKLEVNQAGGAFPGFRISGNSSPGMQIAETSGSVTAHFVNDSAGCYFGTTTSHPLVFRTVNTQKMLLDTSGNLGLGVTPSAWDTAIFRTLQVGSGAGSASLIGRTDGVQNAALGSNFYYGSGSFRYIADGTATWYNQQSGVHAWFSAGSGTAGNPISFTQAMTLTAGGDLALGATSSDGSRLFVLDASGDLALFTNGANADLAIKCVSGVTSLLPSTGVLAFGTNNAERARIDSSGNLLVGTTSNSYGASNIILCSNSIVSGLATSTGYNNTNSTALEGTSGRSIVNHATGASSGSLYIGFGYAGGGIGSITQSGTTAVLFNVTSDQRLKENIVDAPDFGSVIDSIKVRSFDWITDQTHQRAGFIAQELVTVAPEAVHQPIDTDEMMAVDYSKLVPMLVKEIQSLRQRLSAANL